MPFKMDPVTSYNIVQVKLQNNLPLTVFSQSTLKGFNSSASVMTLSGIRRSKNDKSRSETWAKGSLCTWYRSLVSITSWKQAGVACIGLLVMWLMPHGSCLFNSFASFFIRGYVPVEPTCILKTSLRYLVCNTDGVQQCQTWQRWTMMEAAMVYLQFRKKVNTQRNFSLQKALTSRFFLPLTF